MFRFTIRDVLWLMTLVAVVLAMGAARQADRRRMERLEIENRRWESRALFLKDHINITKVNGKWMTPWRIEFDPDTERITTPAR